MIARKKNSFLEVEPVRLSDTPHHKILSRTMSDPIFCRSSASALYYIFDYHSDQWLSTSMDRNALAMPNELLGTALEATNCSLDKANRNGPNPPGTKRSEMHAPQRHSRPHKKQRARFTEFVQELKAQLAERPRDFEIESVEIPLWLKRRAGSEKSLEWVKQTLYELKATLTTSTGL